MATLQARASARNPEVVWLAEGQSGNGVTTNIAERQSSHKGGVLRFIAAAGATPTVTVQIEVSADGSSWSNALSADYATPGATSTATFNITSTTQVRRIVIHQGQTFWRFVRATLSANTNVTLWVAFEYDDSQSPPWS